MPDKKIKNAESSDAETTAGKYTMLPLRPCRHRGCAALVRGSDFCDKHKGQDRRVLRLAHGERGISGEWHSLYHGRRWQELRARQLIAEPYCRDCAKFGLRTKATDVDHIIPHRGDKSIFYDSSNLQSLCHSCHSRKTIEEMRSVQSPPPKKV